MDKRVTSLKTPSELHKNRRPEQFSDSDITYECQLTREQLAFELDQITTNQKHDEFETLCRRLAEKFISPNLVPQVGPTGGGDGKTDSETYPVSNDISDRWFVPEKGWEKDEKWAFAISAKKTWKSKAKSDIKKVIETNRDYSSVYFMSNQKPSSKKRKDAQDEFIKEFKIEVTILDGEWILEKIFNNDLIDLAVDTLNLSQIHKKKISTIGENDARRTKKLLQIEENIKNPSRYSSHDYQLVEDAIESVILSRMLELPRDDVEGKFLRAERFCKKVNNPRQWLKLHYQKAWTYYNWYDDYDSFASEYVKFRSHLSDDANINDVELYTNLVNLLRGLSVLSTSALNELELDIEVEKKSLNQTLEKFINDDTKPSSALIAKTLLLIQTLSNPSLEKQDNSKNSEILSEISEILKKSTNYIEYPFSSFENIILELGNFFPNDSDFDDLIDILAQISEKRDSELSSGNTFLKRGSQKYLAGYYRESVIYFGKAVIKLAKEETQHGYYLALIGLAKAYSNLGLMWASNNCLIAASNVPFKSWFQTGIIDKRVEYCAYELAMNELLIGRIPSFFLWHELFSVVSNNTEHSTNEDDIPKIWFMDACFAIRLLHESGQEELISSLPDILEKQELFISQDTCLYKLGHIESIIKNYEGIDIKEKHELDIYFSQMANQPFRKQMMYELNFVSDETIYINSNILGCEFKFKFKKNIELLLIAETLSAFSESYLSTSLEDVLPKTESIVVSIIENPDIEYVTFNKSKESSSEYDIEVSDFNITAENINALWKSVLTLFTNILFDNFHINEPMEYIKNLFEKEELNERLSIVFQHRNTTLNILGDSPKLFFDQWNNFPNLKLYTQKRPSPITYAIEEIDDENTSKIDPNKVRHDQRKTLSIIDESIWNKAKWSGFGFFVDREGLGIFIGYKHGNHGKSIFDNWIKKLGTKDINEEISITIIKGVDRNNPYWYRVLITSNIDSLKTKPYKLVTILSRFHEMNASTPENLKNLISAFNHFKRYRFCSAESNLSGTDTQLFIEKAIIKTELKIIDAWEIGENDYERSAIKQTDKPIIPKKVSNPPIFQILKP